MVPTYFIIIAVAVKFAVANYTHKIAANCAVALENTNKSGPYEIRIPGYGSSTVYCMLDPKGGLPWTIVQRRVDDSVDFYRNWTEYQRGFGNLSANFFIGLEKLHALTSRQEPQELWVQVTAPDGVSAHAYYDRFAIGNATEQYALKELGEYSGDARDSLRDHEGMKFSTFDNDNDKQKGNCAEYFKGAWWFEACFSSNLNGVYGSTEFGEGVNWNRFRGIYVSMIYAHMGIRPAFIHSEF